MSTPTTRIRGSEIEGPVLAEIHTEGPAVRGQCFARPAGACRTAAAEQESGRAAEPQTRPGTAGEFGVQSFLFDDPYWDEMFDSYHNPTLRTCCRC